MVADTLSPPALPAPMRRSPSRPGLRALLAALALPLALAACEDGPTGPTAHVHPAGGRLWAAVVAPRDLPDARAWLAPLADGGGAGEEAARGVRGLLDEARTLRRRGALQEALLREEEALRAAAAGFSAPPARRVVVDALEGVDRWIGAAEGALQAGPLPEVEAGVAEVRASRGAAESALAEGDTLAAVRYLAAAASRARRHAPDAVALRAFARAGEVVRGGALSRTDSLRAERLLRHAREAVLTGDPERAFRRAVYALQLVEGDGG